MSVLPRVKLYMMSPLPHNMAWLVQGFDFWNHTTRRFFLGCPEWVIFWCSQTHECEARPILCQGQTVFLVVFFGVVEDLTGLPGLL